MTEKPVYNSCVFLENKLQPSEITFKYFKYYNGF